MNSTINIHHRIIGNNRRIYIIAEMACAHNGSVEEARRLIDAASEAKADAIQLQFFVAEETVTPRHEAFSLLKKIEFSPETWLELVDYARNKAIDIWVCTYDVPSVKLAVQAGCDGIKLNSADLANPDILKAVAQSGIPFTLGTGASTLDEVRKGLKILETHGAREVILMHGVQNFPTSIPDLQINRVDLLMEAFPDFPVGYADHTSGDSPFSKIVDLLAVAKGVALIEKHITLDRSKKGIDYQAALEPAEYIDFVQTIRMAETALGEKTELPFSESDLKYRKFQKKSIVAIRDLAKGTILQRDHFKFIRNIEEGLAPTDFEHLAGKQLTRNISKFENITAEDVNH